MNNFVEGEINISENIPKASLIDVMFHALKIIQLVEPLLIFNKNGNTITISMILKDGTKELIIFKEAFNEIICPSTNIFNRPNEKKVGVVIKEFNDVDGFNRMIAILAMRGNYPKLIQTEKTVTGTKTGTIAITKEEWDKCKLKS